MPSRPEKPVDNADAHPMVRLGALLQDLRRRTGKSLKDLESLVHVSDSSLSRYFAGRALPPWPVVQRLCALARQDAESLRPLWVEANRARRTATDDNNNAPTCPTPVPDRHTTESPPARQPGTPHDSQRVPVPSPRRRSRRLLLPAAFVATALAFGTAGLLVGRHIGVRVLTVKPTEDSACRAWPWPGNDGIPVRPPVHPQAADHTVTIDLMVGKGADGRNAAWARITGATLGDRVWLDVSTDGAHTWTQCGPFPVTAGTGTSRAHDTAPNTLFRACGDVPTPTPDARGEMCTTW